MHCRAVLACSSLQENCQHKLGYRIKKVKFTLAFFQFLIDEILNADGSVARTFGEDIEDDDENIPSSSSQSEEESTEYECGSSGDNYVERSFRVLFC